MEMDGFVDVMMGFILSVLCFRHISFSFINFPRRFRGWEANRVFSRVPARRKKKSRNKVQFKVAFLFFMAGIQMECTGYDLIGIFNTECCAVYTTNIHTGRHAFIVFEQARVNRVGVMLV